MSTKTYISIYTSADRDRRLREQSRFEGLSISKLANKALDLYFDAVAQQGAENQPYKLTSHHNLKLNTTR